MIQSHSISTHDLTFFFIFCYYIFMTTLTIPLPKKDEERLRHFALSYGFSLPEFSRRILQELSSEIPEESFADYEHSKELRASFNRALRDWKAGRVSSRL